MEIMMKTIKIKLEDRLLLQLKNNCLIRLKLIIGIDAH